MTDNAALIEQLQKTARQLGQGWRVDLTNKDRDVPDLFNPLQGYRLHLFFSYQQKGKIGIKPKTLHNTQSIYLNWQRPARHLAADISRRLLPQLAELKQKDQAHQDKKQQQQEKLQLLQQTALRIHHRLTPDFRNGSNSYQRELSGGGVQLTIRENEITLGATLNPDLALRVLAMLAEEDRKLSKVYSVTITPDEDSELQPFTWQGLAYSKEDAKSQARNKGHKVNRAYYRAINLTVTEV